eukprot:COSAG06_NODE_1927_length_8051_cov_7.015342_4_plen_66_part_00
MCMDIGQAANGFLFYQLSRALPPAVPGQPAAAKKRNKKVTVFFILLSYVWFVPSLSWQIFFYRNI